MDQPTSKCTTLILLSTDCCLDSLDEAIYTMLKGSRKFPSIRYLFLQSALVVVVLAVLIREPVLRSIHLEAEYPLYVADKKTAPGSLTFTNASVIR